MAADVLIDLGHRPLWFAPFVAACLAPREALCCHVETEPVREALCRLLLARFGMNWFPIRHVLIPPRIHERERHRRLLEACGVPAAPARRWAVLPQRRAEARDFLAEAEIEPGRFIACFPGGAPGTRIKRWPEGNFSAVLREAGLPVLLLGSAEERDLLDRVAETLGDLPRSICAGTSAGLPLTAALLAEARVWLGNDSGLMHLAESLNVPGVAIFGGGGRWPSYAPWSPGTLGLVNPLPCFGCDWDCVLGHALCIESIPAAAASAALRRVLAEVPAEPEIVVLDEVAAPMHEMLADASRSYQAVERDRGDRLEALLRTEAARQALDAAKAMFETAAHERLALLHSMQAEADRRAAEIAALSAAPAERGTGELPVSRAAGPRAFQISIGLGAGNIGDEIMARAFWRALPDDIALDIALFPEAARQHERYPSRHRYAIVDHGGNENRNAAIPGLLVGATPVTEAEGLHWPLQFLSPRLMHFHRNGLPVDAVGVGVEPLRSNEARALFNECFAPIRSWTVRSAKCREALVALGIDAARIRVGADWAWLHVPSRDLRRWAEDLWREIGIDPALPLIVVNVVNMQWLDRSNAKRAIADAIVKAAKLHSLQVAFFCNECRDGAFFDYAAAREMAALLGRPAALVPNAYYSADEAVALLGFATLTVGQRYHFAIQSVLAGTVPICIPRGAKMLDLVAELGIACIGSPESVDSDALVDAIGCAIDDRSAHIFRLAGRQRELAARAAGNLSFLEELPPYSQSFARRS